MDKDDDDLYEIVDYTASSPWERFITSIEQVITSWGLVNGELGIFSSENLKRTSENEQGFNYSFKRETLSLDDDVYSFIYRVQKVSSKSSSDNDTQSWEEFPQFMQTIQGRTFLGQHALSKPSVSSVDPSLHQLEFLHRWTSSSHLLIVYPRNFSQALGGFSSLSSSSTSNQTLSTQNSIIDFNKTQLLISSFAIAFQNCGCSIPVVIPTGPPWKSLWTGYQLWKSSYGIKGEDNGVHTRFKMTHLTPIPPNCTEISYLFSTFKEKYRLHDSLDTSISIASAYSFKTMGYNEENWIASLKQFNFLPVPMNEEDTKGVSSYFPVGCRKDPIHSIVINACFPFLHEVAKKECESSYCGCKLFTFDRCYKEQCDFLRVSPECFITPRFHINSNSISAKVENHFLTTLIYAVISQALNFGQPPSTIKSNSSNGNNNTSNNIHENTESNGQMPRPIENVTSRIGIALLQGRAEGVAMVDNMEVEQAMKKTIAQRTKGSRFEFYGKFPTPEELGRSLKQGGCVHVNSLLWKVLVQSMQIHSPLSEYHFSNSFPAFLQLLWEKMLIYIRDCWRSKKLIPFVNIGDVRGIQNLRPEIGGDQEVIDHALLSKFIHPIDLRTPLVYQKLHLINICIYYCGLDMTTEKSKYGVTEVETEEEIVKNKLKESDKLENFELGNKGKFYQEDEEFERRDTSEDEFFDTMEEFSHSSSPSKLESLKDRDFPQEESINYGQRREGHCKRLNTYPIGKNGQELWVPQSQLPRYLTEDMIQIQEEELEGFGTSLEAAKKRARIQSTFLFSDMEAFKAANPDCCLEDFVKWHSPKDWIQESGIGKLSARMVEPGNLWQELWEKAKGIPVKRQSPLFNFIEEGEKALEYLSKLRFTDFFDQLLPSVFVIAYDSLLSHPVIRSELIVNYLAEELKKLANGIISFPWNEVRNGMCDLNELYHKLSNSENLIGKTGSLLSKFPSQEELVIKMLEKRIDPLELNCVEVTNLEEKHSVYMFTKNRQAMTKKEGISRESFSFPVPTSREYLIQAVTRKTGARPLLQRSYYSVDDSSGEFRMMDAESKDLMFM